MKDYLCPECGRELKKGQKCPVCKKVAEEIDFFAEIWNSKPAGRDKLFKS